MDVVAAIQNSIEIAAKLRALAKKVEDADFKMLLADLSNELADAKLEAANLKGELAGARTSHLKDLQDELQRLNEENESLRKKLKTKSQELVALDQQVRVLTERLSPSTASQLEDLQERILLALTEHEELLEEALPARLSSSKHVTAFHLEELRRRNFVEAASDWMTDPPRTVWSLAHSGREYLMRRGLLR